MVARRKPVVVAVSMALSLPVWAQSGAEAPTLTLGEVVVSAGGGGPLATRSVLSSVDVLPQERIERQAVSHNWQLLGKVPGVMLTEFGQGTTSGKFSMRGFNGEGEINAVKLLIDGVPSNSNDGNMPYIDLAPLLDIEAIEVVRGTNDPRYGLHGIAGNVNIVTKLGGNYAMGRLGYGSFDTRDAQAAAGFEKDGFTQNYAVGYQKGDGYRDHSAFEKAGLSAKWFYSPDNGNSRYGLIVRHHEASADEAGYLTDAQSWADPKMSPAHNAFDDDQRRVTQVAAQAETALGETLHWAAQAYMNDLDDRRYVTFSANVPQQERYVTENHVGASTTLTWRAGATAVGDLTLVGGLDTERQDNRSERYTTLRQVRQTQTRDQQFDFNIYGAFVQAVLKPTRDLSIIPAYRVDRASGRYTNRLNGRTYDVNDYGSIEQPKLSAIYRLAEGYSLYANWGRSFQVGVGTAAYKVNQADDLDPSINEGWEAGLKFRPLNWLEGRVAVWRQTASNEARRRLNDSANDAENIGRTRRQGVDVQLNAQPTEKLGLWLGAAVQRSRILKADAASVATEGKEIDHVPDLLYNLGADYRLSDALRLSAWLQGQSSYCLERSNSTGRFGGYALTHVSATYRASRQVDLELQVRNLGDRYYEYVWYDGTQSLHAPGNGRSIHAMVTARF